ncbi:hypothetical protein HK099_001440 [Clydaea vesicula]|uniref:Peptidase C39-like domain-containing protein n=1 Tax=Clydaea vesicula TaxID=447962 RepID=A0AAD5U3G7_9FUNG|nr:hypothetical protein HK099_001440 [Clydaea vesicula]
MKLLHNLIVTLIFTVSYTNSRTIPKRAISPATCSQAAADKVLPTTRIYSFESKIQPFYQWMNNYGYCAEASLLQAGLMNGQFSSQYNMRSIGTPFNPIYSQTGKKKGIDIYSQLVMDDGIEDAKPGLSNNLGVAASNYLLTYDSFDSFNQKGGQEGYEDYMIWIKKKFVQGDTVIIGALETNSPPYSHVVTVLKIESDYPLDDGKYHADDVIWFDDHGLITKASNDIKSDWISNPSIPPAPGGQNEGYTFDDLKKSYGDEKTYQIPVPQSGFLTKNYAYAINGIEDSTKATLPITLTISSKQNSKNTDKPVDSIAGNNYEHPMIGKSDDGNSKTNEAPASADILDFNGVVHKLVKGQKYNLYKYDINQYPLIGKLKKIPVENFNLNRDMADAYISFTAKSDTFKFKFTTNSFTTVVFRAVLQSAP